MSSMVECRKVARVGKDMDMGMGMEHREMGGMELVVENDMEGLGLVEWEAELDVLEVNRREKMGHYHYHGLGYQVLGNTDDKCPGMVVGEVKVDVCSQQMILVWGNCMGGGLEVGKEFLV